MDSKLLLAIPNPFGPCSRQPCTKGGLESRFSHMPQLGLPKLGYRVKGLGFGVQGLLKLGVPFWGLLMTRIMAFWELYWIPPRYEI